MGYAERGWVHVGTVGNQKDWEIDVQITFALNTQTGQGIWIRPAPMSEMPGDGWNDVTNVGIGRSFTALGLKQIDEYCGYPVCVIKKALKGRKQLTYTEGRAPWSIIDASYGEFCPINLKEVFNHARRESPSLPWTTKIEVEDVENEEWHLYGEVTTIPGKAPRYLLAQNCNWGVGPIHELENGTEWDDVMMNEYEDDLFEYVRSEDNESLRDAKKPEHVIVHKTGAGPYYFVISLGKAGMDDGFVERFLSSDQVWEIKREPKPRT